MRKSLILLVLLHCIACLRTAAQPVDSVKITLPDNPLASTGWNIHSAKHSFSRQMILPGILITYGSIATDNDYLLALDNHIKDEVWNEHPHHLNKMDDFLQYLPGISVYGL